MSMTTITLYDETLPGERTPALSLSLLSSHITCANSSAAASTRKSSSITPPRRKRSFAAWSRRPPPSVC